MIFFTAASKWLRVSPDLSVHLPANFPVVVYSPKQSTDINAKSEEKSTITATEFVILLDGVLLKMCDVESFNTELLKTKGMPHIWLHRNIIKNCDILEFSFGDDKVKFSFTKNL